jgi:hypothetical protein
MLIQEYEGQVDMSDFMRHMMTKKPFVVRNMYKEASQGAEAIKKLHITCEIYGCYQSEDANAPLPFKIPLFETLKETPGLLVTKTPRLWVHQKGKFTWNHYDGNGIEVLNLCLGGSKKFSLAPPNHFTAFPLGNFSFLPDPPSEADIIINKG